VAADKAPEGSKSPAPGTADAPKTVSKTSVTVFLIPAKGYSEKLVARLNRRIGRALRQNKRLSFKDSDRLLLEFAGEVPMEVVQRARTLHREAITAMGAKDMKTAQTKLVEALPLYEAVLPFIKKRWLAEAQLALGATQASLRKRRKALATFRALLTWRPRMHFDPALFPRAAHRLFKLSKRRIRRAKRGSVELKTTPPGARAYVDGRYFGVTPTVAYGLPAGDHYATFKKSGFIKAGLKLTVDRTRQGSFSVTLRRSDKFLLIEQTIAQAKKGLGLMQASAAMVDLRSVLAIDQVIFATIGYAGPDMIAINAFLYDLRSRRLLSKAKMNVSNKKLARTAEIARLLYVNVPYDGTILAPPVKPPPPPPPKRSPLYARWWFWTAIAAGAAAVALPIVFWPRSNECPSGNRCVILSN
jgi:hypothetical protein